MPPNLLDTVGGTPKQCPRCKIWYTEKSNTLGCPECEADFQAWLEEERALNSIITPNVDGGIDQGLPYWDLQPERPFDVIAGALDE